MEATANSLDDWLDWIVVQHQTHTPSGLNRVFRIAKKLDLLRVAKTIIVVGGTNGKGSTVHYLENLCVEANISVGITTSPQLERFNERIRVNGAEVNDETIGEAFTSIQQKQGAIALTFHEYVTLAALVIFKRTKVACAVLEVGLGGRLDATNVSERDVNVITNVGLDHQDRLGLDRTAIGFEKAGILRRGIPLVYGDVEPVPSIRARARALNCPVFRLGNSIQYYEDAEKMWTVEFRHQIHGFAVQVDHIPYLPDSAALAVATAKFAGLNLQSQHYQTLTFLQLPGRCELVEYHGRKWVLDVAHNVSATQFLRRFIQHKFPEKLAFAIIGVLRGKALRDMISTINLPDERIVIVETQGYRGLSIDKINASKQYQAHKLLQSLDDAVNVAQANTASGELIAVFGSFDLVQRMRTMIQSAKDG